MERSHLVDKFSAEWSDIRVDVGGESKVQALKKRICSMDKFFSLNIVFQQI